MNNKIVTLLIVSLFVALEISVSLCDPVYVDASSGCLSCEGKVNSPVSTLQQALNKVFTGGEIIVNPGVYKGQGNVNITLQSAFIKITGSGPSSTILDCEGNSNGFNLFSGTFILSGITIQNCYRNAIVEGQQIGGSAIALYATDSTISNVVIKGNVGWGRGGAISIYSNSVFIINSTIHDNKVVNGSGGAVWVGSAYLELNGTTIKNNVAPSDDQGDDLYCTSASVAVLNGSSIKSPTCAACSIVNDNHEEICQQVAMASSNSLGLWVLLLCSIFWTLL
eukprot:TRINITY_DN2371_c0_g1_i1.p1 TRINITY_DN2371_c0_g1~~TRINITY_DN2371_c0_g1_i1.p1  ORF type:complete len:280 (-),score=45.38 TRINITY_DN2371_c0_g1_i1:94-933(-)